MATSVLGYTPISTLGSSGSGKNLLAIVVLCIGLALTGPPIMAQRAEPIDIRPHEVDVPRDFDTNQIPDAEGMRRDSASQAEKVPPEFHPESPELARLLEPVRLEAQEAGRWGAVVRQIGILNPLTPGAFAQLELAAFEPQFITALPETPSAYSNVFGRSSDQGFALVKEEIGNFKNGILQAANLGGVGHGRGALAKMMDQSASAGKTSVVIIGHSEGRPDGSRVLKLPDETPLPFEEIAQMAGNRGMTCRIVSCYSREIGVNQPLDLRDARILLEKSRQSFELTDESESQGTANQVGASAPARMTVTMRHWDQRLAAVRAQRGYTSIGVVGTTPDAAGRLHLWESISGRPSWLGIGVWSLLYAGFAATVISMLRSRPQSLRRVRSIEELARSFGEQFKRTQSIRRATARALGLAVVAMVVFAFAVMGGEGRYSSATGGSPFGSPSVQVPALAGVGLLFLGVAIPRVEPDRSRAGRLFHACGGIVSGAILVSSVVLGVAGSLAMVAWIWVGLLDVITCLYNGFARLPMRLWSSTRFALTACGVIAAPCSLPGMVRGALAGWHGLPLIPALVYGPTRLMPTMRPQSDSSAGGTSAVGDHALDDSVGSILVGAVVMSLLVGIFGCCLIYIIGTVVWFLHTSPDLTLDDVNRWVLLITAAVTLVTAIGCTIHGLLTANKPRSPEMVASARPAPAVRTAPQRKDEPEVVALARRRTVASISSLLAGMILEPLQSGGDSQLTRAEVSTVGTPVTQLHNQRLPARMWHLILGLGLVVILSCSYLFIRHYIDDPPLRPGSPVMFVRLPGDPETALDYAFIEGQIRPTQTAPLIGVYRVPACFTRPLSSLLKKVPTIEELSLNSLAGKAADSSDDRAAALRGPYGVVFTIDKGQEPGFVDGLVYEGSKAVVVVDDQGGGPERGVLVKLVRDRAVMSEMGPDPGVRAVVRAANIQLSR